MSVEPKPAMNPDSCADQLVIIVFPLIQNVICNQSNIFLISYSLLKRSKLMKGDRKWQVIRL